MNSECVVLYEDVMVVGLMILVKLHSYCRKLGTSPSRRSIEQ